MKKRFTHKWIFIYLGVYFALNLLFLDAYPFMHSDESWLSGLTRAMMHQGFGTTEPFFDLLPRYPHAIKILFHTIQMPFITIGGYNLFAMRLLSLIFGILTLYVFYRLCVLLFKCNVKALVMTAILSLDVQMIYASHMARQDIIITFGIVLVLYYILCSANEWSIKKDITAGIIVGLFIGIHPNSLMIALAAGGLYLYLLIKKKLRIKNLLTLIGTVTLFAALFVGISYSFDGHFLPHYLKFGSTLGVNMTLFEKIRYLPNYFLKLFVRVSGTYYTPPIQLQLILFGIGVLGAAIIAWFKRDALKLLLPLLGVVGGIVLIGRYSQPAVVLIFPLCWLIVFWLADRLPKLWRIITYVLFGTAMLVNSALAIVSEVNNDYDEYITNIEQVVPSDSRVLANLNTAYAFDFGVLRDVRNLEFLDDKKLTFEEYIEEQDIKYIIYSEEMDFIYQKRPVWNIIYGNVHPYFQEMKQFLSEDCTAVASFTSPYAMRIVKYAYEQQWAVTIYRVEGKETP